jgi:hypothetical protein
MCIRIERLWYYALMSLEEKTTKQPWGSLSCEAVQKLIEKQKTIELRPSERNAVFAHCTICDECRGIQRKVLTELLGDTKLEDL